MKLYTKCTNCKSDISFWTWTSDRVGFKKSNGDYISLTCKNCNQNTKYHIDDVKAKESKLAYIIALLIFLAGTPILFLFLWDYMFMTNNIYTILGLVIPLIVPSLIFGIITKNDRQRVRLFNRS